MITKGEVGNSISLNNKEKIVQFTRRTIDRLSNSIMLFSISGLKVRFGFKIQT